ncbi:MAG: hypothetical protein AAF220_00135 [Pseudomonadota bacterium]
MVAVSAFTPLIQSTPTQQEPTHFSSARGLESDLGQQRGNIARVRDNVTEASFAQFGQLGQLANQLV